MKNIIKQTLIIFLILTNVNCRTTRFIDSWKGESAASFQADKILIIAITSNEPARKQFETQLAKEFKLRGIEVIASFTQKNILFTNGLKTEIELKEIEDELLILGFDSILLTKIIGIEDRVSFAEAYTSFENTYKSFSTEYYMNQQVYHDVEYYEKYKVYHGETQLYCLCPTKKRSLIWKGYIDIFTPTSVNKTVKSYIKQITCALEKDLLLRRK